MIRSNSHTTKLAFLAMVVLSARANALDEERRVSRTLANAVSTLRKMRDPIVVAFESKKLESDEFKRLTADGYLDSFKATALKASTERFNAKKKVEAQKAAGQDADAETKLLAEKEQIEEQAMSRLDAEEAKVKTAKEKSDTVNKSVELLAGAKAAFGNIMVLINSEKDMPEQSDGEIAKHIRSLVAKVKDPPVDDDSPLDDEGIATLTKKLTGKVEKSELGQIRSAMEQLVDALRSTGEDRDKAKARSVSTLYRMVRGLAARAGIPEQTSRDKQLKINRTIQIDPGETTLVFRVGAVLVYADKPPISVKEPVIIGLERNGEVTQSNLTGRFRDLGIEDEIQSPGFTTVTIASRLPDKITLIEEIEIPFGGSYVCVAPVDVSPIENDSGTYPVAGIQLEYPTEIRDVFFRPQNPQTNPGHLVKESGYLEQRNGSLNVAMEMFFRKETIWSVYNYQRYGNDLDVDESAGQDSDVEEEKAIIQDSARSDTAVLYQLSAGMLTTAFVYMPKDELSPSPSDPEDTNLLTAPRFNADGLLDLGTRRFTEEQWDTAADEFTNNSNFAQQSLAALDLAMMCHASSLQFDETIKRDRSEFFMAVCRASYSQIFVQGGTDLQKSIIVTALPDINEVDREIRGLTGILKRLKALEPQPPDRSPPRSANLIPYELPLFKSRIHRLPIYRTVKWLPHSKHFVQPSKTSDDSCVLACTSKT